MNCRATNHRSAQGGSALIEFAFIVPVTVLLALGVFDFAYAIQQAFARDPEATAATKPTISPQ